MTTTMQLYGCTLVHVHRYTVSVLIGWDTVGAFAAPPVRRSSPEAEQSARTAISKLIVSYEKNEFSTHDGEFFTAYLGPTLGSNLIPTIMYLGKVTTRVNDPHQNLDATKSCTCHDPSLSQWPVCHGSFKIFGALSLRVAPWSLPRV